MDAVLPSPSSPKGGVARTYFHPEEDSQFGVLEECDDKQPGTRYLVAFSDGESYICRYFASYESENSGELDIEMEDQATRFYQIAMNIVETIRTGVRGYREGFTLDYRDWPALIKDLDRGTTRRDERQAHSAPTGTTRAFPTRVSRISEAENDVRTLRRQS